MHNYYVFWHPYDSKLGVSYSSISMSVIIVDRSLELFSLSHPALWFVFSLQIQLACEICHLPLLCFLNPTQDHRGNDDILCTLLSLLQRRAFGFIPYWVPFFYGELYLSRFSYGPGFYSFCHAPILCPPFLKSSDLICALRVMDIYQFFWR